MQHDACLKYFSSYIEKELGIIYAEHNLYQLTNRLEEIAKIYSLPDIGALYEKAKAGIAGDFRQLVLDIATNNETSFFRDPKVYQALEQQVIPAIESGLGPQETLRIWCAASSFGQEPYSLSILLSELRGKGLLRHSYEILATDIAARALERARSGRYSQLEIQRGLPAPLLVKYFSKDDENYWTLHPEIRQSVKFQSQNLKSPFKFPHPFHLVLCRNVLIYQGIESKTEILNRISACMKPKGYLVLGAGESLLGIASHYEMVATHGVVVYRLKNENHAGDTDSLKAA